MVQEDHFAGGTQHNCLQLIDVTAQTQPVGQRSEMTHVRQRTNIARQKRSIEAESHANLVSSLVSMFLGSLAALICNSQMDLWQGTPRGNHLGRLFLLVPLFWWVRESRRRCQIKKETRPEGIPEGCALSNSLFHPNIFFMDLVSAGFRGCWGYHPGLAFPPKS